MDKGQNVCVIQLNIGYDLFSNSFCSTLTTRHHTKWCVLIGRVTFFGWLDWLVSETSTRHGTALNTSRHTWKKNCGPLQGRRPHSCRKWNGGGACLQQHVAMTVVDDTINKQNICASVCQPCLDTLCCSNCVAYCSCACVCLRVQYHVHSRSGVTEAPASCHAMSTPPAESRKTPGKSRQQFWEASLSKVSNRWRCEGSGKEKREVRKWKRAELMFDSAEAAASTTGPCLHMSDIWTDKLDMLDLWKDSCMLRVQL